VAPQLAIGRADNPSASNGSLTMFKICVGIIKKIKINKRQPRKKINYSTQYNVINIDDAHPSIMG
jgi:hypothetical protein